MASDRRRMIALGCLAVGLAGCTTSDQTGLAKKDNFGEAYRQTLAAQVIDPAPEYDTPQAPVSGDTMAQAVERQRTGKTKQPDRQTIGDIGKPGSGGAATTGSGGN